MSLRNFILAVPFVLAPCQAFSACAPSPPPISWSSSGLAIPATVFDEPRAVTALTLVIFRHAEKPILPNEELAENGNLGSVGTKRAYRLPDRLLKLFGCPDLLVSTNPAVKAKNHITGQYFNYIRPLATIAPLSGKIGFPVWTPYGYDQTDLLVRDFLGDKAFAPTSDGKAKKIFVAWRHANIPVMLQQIIESGKFKLLTGISLKVNGRVHRCETPRDWEQCDFDSIWLINIREGEVCLTPMKQDLNSRTFLKLCKGGLDN